MEALNCEFGIKSSVCEYIQRGQRRWIRRGNFFYAAACINKCAEENYFPLNLARIYFRRTLPSTPLLHINKHAPQNQVAFKKIESISFYTSTIFNTWASGKGLRYRKDSSYSTKFGYIKHTRGKFFSLTGVHFFTSSDTVLNSFANSTFLKNASQWMGAHAKSPPSPAPSLLRTCLPVFCAYIQKEER